MAIRITGDETNFKTMSRIELARWYEINVGYDPIEDEPRTTLGCLRRLCHEYREAVDEAEANNWNW